MSASGDTVVATKHTTVRKASPDFFGIPRELRENIYSHLTIEKALPFNPYIEKASSAARAEFSLTHTPTPKVLLICQQAKSEYEKYVYSNATLRFEHKGLDFSGSLPFEGSLISIRKAHIQFLLPMIVNFNEVEDGVHARMKLRKCVQAQLPELRRLEVDCVICVEEGDDNDPVWSGEVQRKRMEQLQRFVSEVKPTEMKYFTRVVPATQRWHAFSTMLAGLLTPNVPHPGYKPISPPDPSADQLRKTWTEATGWVDHLRSEEGKHKHDPFL